MSKYKNELRVRLARDGWQAAAEWFVRTLAKDERISGYDLSELEAKFLLDIEEHRRLWLKQQTKH
jgi:hypothetical protein